MKSRIIMLAFAGASLIAGGQALAQGHGRGHGPSAQGATQGQVGRTGAGAGLGADLNRGRGIETRTDARVNSRAPDRANDRAIERSNENSVLSGTVRPPRTDLSALRTGLTVRTSTGTNLGTIRRVNRSADGSVRSVLVDSAEGRRTIPVRPGSLSISGDVVTTTQLRPPRN
jgi:hypothetical protein